MTNEGIRDQGLADSFLTCNLSFFICHLSFSKSLPAVSWNSALPGKEAINENPACGTVSATARRRFGARRRGARSSAARRHPLPRPQPEPERTGERAVYPGLERSRPCGRSSAPCPRRLDNTCEHERAQPQELAGRSSLRRCRPVRRRISADIALGDGAGISARRPVLAPQSGMVCVHVLQPDHLREP